MNHIDPELIARALTPGSRRALLAMTSGWQHAGKATFHATGAHCLVWYSKRDPLAQESVRAPGRRPMWRLTERGLAVREHLERGAS